MKKNVILIVSLVLNILLLGLFFVYWFTPYVDVTILNKSLPRFCDYAKETNPDLNLPVCNLETK